MMMMMMLMMMLMMMMMMLMSACLCFDATLTVGSDAVVNSAEIISDRLMSIRDDHMTMIQDHMMNLVIR